MTRIPKAWFPRTTGTHFESFVQLVLRAYSRLMPDSADLVRIALDSAWSVTDVSPGTEHGTVSGP
jgi:hypothetical protein